MDPALRAGEAPAALARRLVHEGIRSALQALSAAASGIHACRKEVRATRAYLRLVEGMVPGRARTPVEALLREAAHQLSQIRDQDALLERLGQWRTGHATAVALIEPVVRAQKRLQTHHLPTTIAAVRRALRSAASCWGAARVHGGWKTLLEGHVATWRAAHAAWRRVPPVGTPAATAHEPWHRLRRRAKDLRHQHDVLAPLLPDVMHGWGKAWHALSDDLGEFQDLRLLLALIGLEAGATDLRAPLQQRQLAVEQGARQRAAPLLAEHARHVQHRLQRWHRAWVG